MTVYPLQVNFNRGEISPYMHARSDTEHYAAGAARAHNVIVNRFGGLLRCPGTLYGGGAAASAHANPHRLIPFRFNRSQVYAIEASDELFRFWIMGSTGPERIEDSGPVEVTTPYSEDDLANLKVQQSGDVLYIVCDGYPPQTLTRNSETSWTLAEYEPMDGPYLPVNTTSTTMTPASTAHASVDHTANNQGGNIVSSSNGTDSWRIFDREKGSYGVIDTDSSGWVKYQFASSAQKVVDAYWLTAPDNNSQVNDMPSQWEFQGSNDNSTWITLDSRDGEEGWSNSETRFFEFQNEQAFEYYRLNCSGGGGSDGTTTAIGELAMHQKASDQTPFNLTASSTTGINDGDGFQTTDVGRAIRLYGADGVWRWAEIVARTSSTVVTIRLHGHALPDTSAILLWRMGVWSDETGWPNSIAIYEDRMTFGGSDESPIGLWASRNADYDNFGVSDPLLDDDGIAITLTGGELNRIKWIAAGRDILAGTEGSLRAVGRNNAGSAFAPANIRQRNETYVGACGIDPVLIENMILFLDANETRLYEAAYTYEAEGYVARELSVLNEHLLEYGCVEMAYQEHPHRVIWILRADGKLVACTYDRTQKVFGATEVDIGGEVESILCLPNATLKRTDLFLIVKRDIDGSEVRYIEGLAEYWREDYTAQDVPVYAACAAIYDGADTNTVTGLGHLEDEEVGIWADGRDVGDATVASGEIDLPGGLEAGQIVVGIRMPWEAQTLRLTSIGNRDGAALGRRANVHEAYIDLYESAGVRVSSLSSEEDIMRFEDDIVQDPFDPMPLRTGAFPVTVDDSWANNGQIKIHGSSMYPAMVRAISLGVEGEP